MNVNQKLAALLTKREKIPQNNLKLISPLTFLLIILISLILVVAFLPYGTSLILKAKSESEPKNVSISNITDISFTISWGTQGEVEGVILYGTDLSNLERTAYDNNAGLEGKDFKTSSHVITLTSLNPTTLYYYKIVSGGKIYSGSQKHIFEPVRTLIYSPQTSGKTNQVQGVSTKNSPSHFYQLFFKR